MKTDIPATDPENRTGNQNDDQKNINNNQDLKNKIRKRRKNYSKTITEPKTNGSVPPIDSNSHENENFTPTAVNISNREIE